MCLEQDWLVDVLLHGRYKHRSEHTQHSAPRNSCSNTIVHESAGIEPEVHLVDAIVTAAGSSLTLATPSVAPNIACVLRLRLEISRTKPIAFSKAPMR